VDRWAGRFAARPGWARAFKEFAFPRAVGGNALSLRIHDSAAAADFDPDLPELLTKAGSERLEPDWICFFFGDELKERIVAHFDDKVPDTFRGGALSAKLSLAERRDQVAKLSAEQQALQKEYDQLGSELEGLPVIRG
jgi:hypothetical protein